MSPHKALSEALEETGQDAARFRWLAQNPNATRLMFSRSDGAASEDCLSWLRQEIDGMRYEPPTSLDAPGGRYNGRFNDE